jgi:hypothetical protein
VREKDALLRDLELQLEEAQHSCTPPLQQLELQQQAVVLTDVTTLQQQRYSRDEVLSSDVSSDVSAPSALPHTSLQQQLLHGDLLRGASSSSSGATTTARPRRSYSVSAASGCSMPLLTTTAAPTAAAAVPAAAAAAAPRRHSIAIGRMHEVARHHQQEVTPPSLFSEIRVLDMGHVAGPSDMRQLPHSSV